LTLFSSNILASARWIADKPRGDPETDSGMLVIGLVSFRISATVQVFDGEHHD